MSKHLLDFNRVILTLVVGVAAIASAAGCAKHGATPAVSPTPALAVTVATARRGDLAEHVVLTGIINAKAQANLQSAITGQVVEVDALVGDRVSAGEVLVRIDDSIVRAQLEQNIGSLNAARAHLVQVQTGDVGAASSAVANLDSAQVAYQTALANYDRNKQLLAQGYVSQSAVDQAAQAAAAAQAQLRGAQVAEQNAQLNGRVDSSAQAEIRNAQAAVDEAQGAVELAQAQLAQTVIRAPFDGVLTQRSVDPGTLAAPGTPLVQVSELDPVYVNVNIPEENLPYIHAGTEVDLSVDSLPGSVWHARVDAVNAATTTGTLSYLARIVVPNPGFSLKAGMVADASFVKSQRKDVVIVPRAAVFEGESGDQVYVLAKESGCACDGTAKAVNVRVGLQTDTDAEISGRGIAPGTVVIVQRPDALKEGSPVSISSSSGQATSSSQALQ
ncbi:MAG TPA: efflux RND transporter periplasmic adaptor subunit [Candidatus Acidoferrales bacterium]|nr:efflux RND transporter periplasmic adaptor subunit [Candidatus Acidoferrales bacterium]